jgi:hypothetical protein
MIITLWLYHWHFDAACRRTRALREQGRVFVVRACERALRLYGLALFYESFVSV